MTVVLLLRIRKMRPEERIKLFKDVFAPKPSEKILFLVDIPHDDIRDSLLLYWNMMLQANLVHLFHRKSLMRSASQTWSSQ